MTSPTRRASGVIAAVAVVAWTIAACAAAPTAPTLAPSKPSATSPSAAPSALQPYLVPPVASAGQQCECISGVLVGQDEVTNQSAVEAAIDQLRNTLGVQVVWQYFDASAGEQAWGTVAAAAKAKDTALFMSNITANSYTPTCNRDGTDCELAPQVASLSGWLARPDIAAGNSPK